MAAGKSRPRARGPQEQADAEARRAERLDALHRQLADGVAAIRDGAAWTAWLDTAARFHRYSFRNQVLIAAQRPGATAVAGFEAWKAMGRQVRKGEKALWILAPVTVRSEHRPGEQPPPAAPGGEPAQRRLVGFRPAAVFDVAQTDGEPLPEPPRPLLLAGQAPPGLWDALAAEVEARGFTVHRSPDAPALGGANGRTDFHARTVTVRGDVDDAQAVKTLAHEAGHVLLHDPGGEGRPDCRGLIEVEAESVAYLVSAHHGLDTAGYSFAYIAGWAGRDEQAVTATAGRVLSAAARLLAATDPGTGSDPRAAGLARTAARQARTTGLLAAHAETVRDRAATAAAAGRQGPDPAAARLRAAVGQAQAWFLAQAAGSPDYAAAAAARGHRAADAAALGAGWAPPGWTGLVDHLRAQGYTDTELLDAGLASQARGGRLIDRFRGRITFPVHDAHGPVGFTARDATDRPDAPKYLNTPAGALFAKSRLLYGTQHLGPGTRSAVLVEGPWDALAVTAATDGTAAGVAACGTAVTGQHLDLLASTGLPLVLAPDTDPPGIEAMRRTLALITDRGGPHPAAVGCPPGSDPADVHAAGPGTLAGLLATAEPAALVHARAHLAAAGPPSPFAEARIAQARRAAAAAAGLGPADRARLAEVLVEHGGIGAEAAAAVIDDTGAAQGAPAPPPKPAGWPAAVAAPRASATTVRCR